MSGSKGISSVKGFQVSSAGAGIKYAGRDDCVLLCSEKPMHIAGVFTQNKVQAESLLLCREHLNKESEFHGVFVNSGNANCCTGEEGYKGAAAILKALGGEIGISEESLLIASTGVIGEPFPAERVVAVVPELVKGLQKGDDKDLACAEAIMTTDTFPKSGFKTCVIEGETISLAGIAKGAGMIEPRMGTMLCFLATDAKIETPLLQEMLKEAVNLSFNRITVDGDTSTNDTVLLMANGASEKALHSSEEQREPFQKMLNGLCIDLAKMIVQDAEGATKLVNIIVKETFSVCDALTLAKKIANSPLVKTALHGEDPNWGRIVAAAGNSTVPFDIHKASLSIGSVPVLKEGKLVEGYNEKHAAEVMKNREFAITLSCGSGFHEANVWTSDFSSEYISINADYRS